MKYIDDVLYLLGWVCLIVCGFSYEWRIGLIVMAAAFWATSILWARAAARIMQKSRDEPGRDRR